MTRLLALDCSSEQPSIALSDGAAIRSRQLPSGRQQSEHVLESIEGLFAEMNVRPRDLDAIAVGIGPGAFTGVRLAIAVTQGLAMAWDCPVVPVSTLATQVVDAGIDTVPARSAVLSLLDARMGEVYAGWFRLQQGRPIAMADEQVLSPADLRLPPAIDSYLVAGIGHAVFESAVIAALGEPHRAFPTAAPNAASIIRMIGDDWRSLAIPAIRIEPVYLRNKVALTTIEREQAAHAAQGDRLKSP